MTIKGSNVRVQTLDGREIMYRGDWTITITNGVLSLENPKKRYVYKEWSHYWCDKNYGAVV